MPPRRVWSQSQDEGTAPCEMLPAFAMKAISEFDKMDTNGGGQACPRASPPDQPGPPAVACPRLPAPTRALRALVTARRAPAAWLPAAWPQVLFDEFCMWVADKQIPVD